MIKLRKSPAVPVALAAASLLALIPSAARADYAVLRSGTRLHISGYELDGEQVHLSLTGGSVTISSDDLLSVEPEDVFRELPPTDAALNVRYAKFIRAAAQKHSVDQRIIAEVIAAESNFNERAVSRKRALGLMQLLPETAARYSVRNVFDPEQNIDAGAHYLKDLLGRYRGNLTFALAAYNAGPEMVDRYRGVPPFAETRNYVREITARLKKSDVPMSQANAAQLLLEP